MPASAGHGFNKGALPTGTSGRSHVAAHCVDFDLPNTRSKEQKENAVFQMPQSIAQHLLQNAVAYTFVTMAIVVMCYVISYARRNPEGFKLWLKGAWYKMPVIGAIASLSRRTEVASDGWFQSEITLCDDFYAERESFFSNPEHYEKATRYLQKVQEYGRQPIGGWRWCAIIGLTGFEAILFGFVVIDVAIPGDILTTNMAVWGAFVTGALIAGVLTWLAHRTGAEMHHGDLIRKARGWWANASDGESSNRPIVIASGGVGIFNNEKDDNEPPYIQILNRVEHNEDTTPGDKKWIWATAVVTLIVVVAIAVIRYATSLEDRETETDWESYKAILTFAVMAGVLVIIQSFSAVTAQKHAFVGYDSLEAYKLTKRFRSAEHFELWQRTQRDKVATMAGEMLTLLQEKLRQQVTEKGKKDEPLGAAAKKRDFDDYLERRKTRGMRTGEAEE